MRDLEIERWGSGPPVVLVHGGLLAGEASWHRQRPLAERWQLVVVSRAGYGRSAPRDGDFNDDAADIADLIGSGAHLVGHSYGGVVAMLAAARRPEAVSSLTLIEPAALAIGAGDPHVQPLVDALTAFGRSAPTDPKEFVSGFARVVGAAEPPPGPLPAPLEQAARAIMTDRPVAQAQIPYDELARSAYPKLVISGAHNPGFERLCDLLAERIGGERAAIEGAGHAVQMTGAPFNDRLEAFLGRA